MGIANKLTLCLWIALIVNVMLQNFAGGNTTEQDSGEEDERST